MGAEVEEVSELARGEAAEQEADEGYADVGGDEEVVSRREDYGDGQEDGVAGLVGGEAVVVLESVSVL